jgi:hypothetical protein
VDALVEKIDHKLREWKPETAAEVRSRLDEIIRMADDDALDLSRARTVEQEVLDLIDSDPASR